MVDEIKSRLPERWMNQAMGEDEVRGAIADGAVLLTGSQTLAMDWKRRLVLNGQGSVVATPAVHGWRAWLGGLSVACPGMPVAFNRLQELRLWERVIAADLAVAPQEAGRAASVRGLAQHAMQALACIREYRMDLDALVHGGEEAEALLRWISALYQDLDRYRERMLACDMAERLASRLGGLELPECLLFDGFDVLTPMQCLILEGLKQAGCRLLFVESAMPAASPVWTACRDTADEYARLAGRVRELLADRPDAHIAIAHAAPDADTAMLRRMLDEALSARDHSDARVLPAVAAAEPLASMPLVRAILHLLSLAGARQLPFADVSAILLMPWLRGAEQERISRARLDVRFRRQNRHVLGWRSLLQGRSLEGMPELRRIMEALAAWKAGRRSAEQWVTAVHGLLRELGFLRSSACRADEIRQLNAFLDTLQSLVAMDAVDDGCSWQVFLSLLRMRCHEKRLTGPCRYPNIAIMPLSEIGGLRFDHVFVTDMDEEAFPMPPRPQPLLPAALQKRHGLPMSHASLAYEASLRLWQQLLRTTKHIHISHAETRGDRELLPSSFLSQFPQASAAALPPAEPSLTLEDFVDAPACPLREGEQPAGGTAIVRNQSACPFRAFATHRLGIRPLESTEPGINAAGKGSLIHGAMEYIWRVLRRKSALDALSEAARDALLEEAIAYAWEQQPLSIGAGSRQVEKKRMLVILKEWLDSERARPAFEVMAVEDAFELALPGPDEQRFCVHIKADRIDLDAEGRRILIDYKTGARQSWRQWLADEHGRIAEPQLPQYALAAGLGKEDAVCFARLRLGDMGFEGMAGENIGIEGVVPCDAERGRPEDWGEVLESWRSGIRMLAEEFVQGRGDVAPSRAGVCRYCRLEALCRIDEVDIDALHGEDET